MLSHRDQSTPRWCVRHGARKRSRSARTIYRSAALARPRRSRASPCSWPHPSPATSPERPWWSTEDRSRQVPTWSKSIAAAKPARDESRRGRISSSVEATGAVAALCQPPPRLSMTVTDASAPACLTDAPQLHASSFGCQLLSFRLAFVKFLCSLLPENIDCRAMEYYQYFRLKGPPFRPASPDGAVYLSPTHLEGLSTLESGLSGELTGLTLLSGEGRDRKNHPHIFFTAARLQTSQDSARRRPQALVPGNNAGSPHSDEALLHRIDEAGLPRGAGSIANASRQGGTDCDNRR